MAKREEGEGGSQTGNLAVKRGGVTPVTLPGDGALSPRARGNRDRWGTEPFYCTGSVCEPLPLAAPRSRPGLGSRLGPGRSGGGKLGLAKPNPRRMHRAGPPRRGLPHSLKAPKGRRSATG